MKSRLKWHNQSEKKRKNGLLGSLPILSLSFCYIVPRLRGSRKICEHRNLTLTKELQLLLLKYIGLQKGRDFKQF